MLKCLGGGGAENKTAWCLISVTFYCGTNHIMEEDNNNNNNNYYY